MSKIAMTFFCVCAMLLIGAANGKTSEKSEVVKITIRAGSWYLMVDENDEGQLGFGSNIQVPIKSGAFVFFDLLKKLEGSSFKRSEILNFTDRGNNNYAGVTFWKEGQVSAHADYVKNTEVVDIFDKALRNVIVFKTKEYHFDKALERNPPLGLKAERKISNEEELREYISNQNSLHASRILKIQDYEKKHRKVARIPTEKLAPEKKIETKEKSLNLILGSIVLLALGLLICVKLRRS